MPKYVLTITELVNNAPLPNGVYNPATFQLIPSTRPSNEINRFVFTHAGLKKEDVTAPQLMVDLISTIAADGGTAA